MQLFCLFYFSSLRTYGTLFIEVISIAYFEKVVFAILIYCYVSVTMREFTPQIIIRSSVVHCMYL